MRQFKINRTTANRKWTNHVPQNVCMYNYFSVCSMDGHLPAFRYWLLLLLRCFWSMKTAYTCVSSPPQSKYANEAVTDSLTIVSVWVNCVYVCPVMDWSFVHGVLWEAQLPQQRCFGKISQQKIEVYPVSPFRVAVGCLLAGDKSNMLCCVVWWLGKIKKLGFPYQKCCFVPLAELYPQEIMLLTNHKSNVHLHA